VILLSPQLTDQVGNTRSMTNCDHAPHARPAAPAPVQTLTQGVPGQEIKRGRARQGNDNVSAGYVGLGYEGYDGDRCGKGRSNVEHLTKLVGAKAHESRVVTARYRHGGHPEDRHQRREHQVLARPVGPADKPDFQCDDPGSEGADAVSRSGGPEI
jgi:hypothetical protein